MDKTRRVGIRYGMIGFFLVLFLTLFAYSFVQGATATTGTVTATLLNIRKSASSSSESLGKLQMGTQVTILGTKKDSNKEVWYNIQALVKEKKVEGYVHSKYVKGNPVYSYINKTGKTNASVLNIRKSTSTASAVLAKVPNGTRVTIIGETTVSGTKWVKLNLTVNGKNITGYTHSVYVTRDVTTTSTNQYLFGIAKFANVEVYNKANTYTKLKAKLNKNQEVIILGTFNVGQTSWYKVKVKMNDSNVYGYVKASNITKQKATVSSTENLKATVTTKTNAYQVASSVSKKIKSLSVGQTVTVKGTLTVNSVKWYRCNFKVSGTSYTAYIPASYVQLDAEAEFEQSIKDFPESYKASLRALHEKNPNWIFVPVQTGLDWATVIENESRTGRNTIQSNVPKGGSVSSYSFPFSYLSTEVGAYNWATDTYTLMDGSNWYTAARQVIEYYMDPRNSLTEQGIWQFEALAYDEKQELSVVKKILESTFMAGDYSCIDSATKLEDTGNYAQTFMKVGELSGASPYFLATRAKQELGVNGSGSVSGTYPGYAGIYNFYNIGANDSSTGQAIANGLKWASTGTTYQRPWTSISKSLLGGSQYIATSYINKGQNTTYFQKFNVVYAPFYAHQYMTNVMAPTSEARLQYNSYQSLGILDGSYVFYIPVYQNMPSTAAKLPASAGNPNSFLKSLTASYKNTTLSLTPTFNYQTTSYTMVVAEDIEEIVLKGTAVSKHGTVTGLGTYSLEPGKTTTIKITCTAGNGTSTTYTLKVSRLAS